MYESQFGKGNYYMIICKANDSALKIQQEEAIKYQKSRIISAKPNSDDNSQIFMIQHVGTKEDQYEIVNALSSFVCSEQSGQIKIRLGKMNKNQLFAIQPAPIKEFFKYYWIKTQFKGNKALKLQGFLRYSDFNPNDQSQLFRFQLATNNSVINKSSIIINNNSNMAIDIPKSSRKQGQQLIQWPKHKRWNQRWYFVRQGKGFVIRSAFNGLVLDICAQSRENGAKVIQYCQTGGLNQQWFPQTCGNNLYKFRSCFQPTLFLAIRKQKKDKDGQLQVSNVQNASMYWRIQGPPPRNI